MYLPRGVLLIAYPPLHPVRPTPRRGRAVSGRLCSVGAFQRGRTCCSFFLFVFLFLSCCLFGDPRVKAAVRKKKKGGNLVPNVHPFPPKRPFHLFHPFHGEPWAHKSHPSLSASSCSFRRGGRFVSCGQFGRFEGT